MLGTVVVLENVFISMTVLSRTQRGVVSERSFSHGSLKKKKKPPPNQKAVRFKPF